MTDRLKWAKENERLALEHAAQAVAYKMNGQLETAQGHEMMAHALLRTADSLRATQRRLDS